MWRWVLGAALLAAAGACAADVAADAAAGVPTPAQSYADAPVELKWDTGTMSYAYAWYTGAGSWVGVDFSIATLTDYRLITDMRLYCRVGWPNAVWDGGRMGVYAFSGSIPGSLLWGPTWFRPTLSASGFQDFDIGWTLPTGQTSFILAWEQYYQYPNGDAFVVDNNHTATGHSWQYYAGSWSYMSNSSTGYNNLMLRAVVDDVNNTGVAPTSLGRVKAVYY